MSAAQLLSFQSTGQTPAILGAGTATLAAGTVAITVNGVKTSSKIFVSSAAAGVTGALRAVPTANTITITSSVGGDAGAVSWFALQ